MAVPFTAMHGSVRFSLSTYTTEEEIDRIIDVFPHIVEGLRKASPYWDSVNNKPREDGVMA
jgi:cysteine desulfurase